MTPPATTAPRRADAVRNRQKVLDAATDAFTELGLEARMEEIARRAGVGVGTVYRHFPTKEALLGELLAEKWRALRDTVQHSLDHEPDPWEAYAGALKRNAEIMAGDAAVRGAIMLSDSPEVWDHAAGAHQELMEVTELLVERGKAAGVLRGDLAGHRYPADDGRGVRDHRCPRPGGPGRLAPPPGAGPGRHPPSAPPSIAPWPTSSPST